MLVVKVEVWKFGNPADVEPLGVLLISNKGHVEGDDPDACLYDIGWQGEPKRREVLHFRRRGWKRLVTRALEEMA